MIELLISIIAGFAAGFAVAAHNGEFAVKALAFVRGIIAKFRK